MRTLIKHVTLYNGKGGKEENASVLFENGVFVDAGKGLENATAEEVMDGTGLVVLPGLINSHVHIALDGKPNMQGQIRADSSEGLVMASALKNAMKTVASGVVTVRDMGCAFNASLLLRDAIAKGQLAGPRIFTSGRVICMTGGHGADFGIESDGPEECRKATRLQRKAGVDLIKIMATGGGQSKGMKAGATQLSEEEIAAIVREAQKAGLPTAAHAQGKEGVMNCLRAGVESIEHGVTLDQEQVDTMLRQNTFFCATLLSPWYVVQYGVENGIPDYVVEKCKIQVVDHFKSFELAVKNGVRIIAGNDAGTPFNFHDDLPGEMKQMVALGMPVRDVITSATSRAAEALYMEEKMGSIEKGKWADLTILKADPEQDIDNLKKVHSVWKAGSMIYSNLDGKPWFAVPV